MNYWENQFSTGYRSKGLLSTTASQQSEVVSILSAGTFFGALASPLMVIPPFSYNILSRDINQLSRLSANLRLGLSNADVMIPRLIELVEDLPLSHPQSSSSSVSSCRLQLHICLYSSLADSLRDSELVSCLH